jgi:hypothetical protein
LADWALITLCNITQELTAASTKGRRQSDFFNQAIDWQLKKAAQMRCFFSETDFKSSAAGKFTLTSIRVQYHWIRYGTKELGCFL